MTRLSLIAIAAAVAIVPALPAMAAQVPSTRPPVPHDGGNTPSTSSAGASCDTRLGALPRVYPVEISGVTEQNRVWVTEICEDGSLMRNEGNAAYLRPYIADNVVLVSALQDRSFFPADVYAVKMMGDGTVNLFVHHFVR